MKNFSRISLLILFLPVIVLAENVDCHSPEMDLSHEPKCKPGELTIIQELAADGKLGCKGHVRKLVSCPGTSKETKLIPKDNFSSFIGSQFDDPDTLSALRTTNSLSGTETVKELAETLDQMDGKGIAIDDNGNVAEFKKLQYLRDKYSIWLKSNQSALGLTKADSLSSVVTENQRTIAMLKSKTCKSPEYNEVLKSSHAVVVRFDDGFEQMIFPYDFQYQSDSKLEVSYTAGIAGRGGMFAIGTETDLHPKKGVFYTDTKGQVFLKSGDKPPYKTYKISGMRTISLKDSSKNSDGQYVDPCKIQALINANIPAFSTTSAAKASGKK
jgi:hypothetical protein